MANAPIATAGANCPLYKKDVSKVCHHCAWYVQIRGKHPQTGEDVDDWLCSIAWMPLLQIEMAQKQNHTAAAIESFRNEMVKQNENLQLTLINTEVDQKNKQLSKPNGA